MKLIVLIMIMMFIQATTMIDFPLLSVPMVSMDGDRYIIVAVRT
jgi:hypothetical protein